MRRWFCGITAEDSRSGGSDEGFLDDRTLGSRDEYVLDCTLPEHGDLGAKQGTWGAAPEAPRGTAGGGRVARRCLLVS